MDQRDQGPLGGAVQGGAVYASPNDFPDMLEPLDTKQNVNIEMTVGNVILHHVSESADRQNQHRTWRRKVREILMNHQEKILQFFTKKLPETHPLKTAHILLTKYGKTFAHDRQIPQFFKDFIGDSPQTGLEQLNKYLNDLSNSRAQDSPVGKWLNMSRHMLDYLRDTGDELIRVDQRLQMECQRIDGIVDKVSQLVSLPDPDIEGFQDMMSKYIEKQFQSTDLEKLYWDYIFTLQKYSTLREILIPQRIANQSDPLCCICMTEPIVMAMSPCGHTFCTNCSKKTIVCHICRQQVISRLRVFFG